MLGAVNVTVDAMPLWGAAKAAPPNNVKAAKVRPIRGRRVKNASFIRQSSPKTWCAIKKVVESKQTECVTISDLPAIPAKCFTSENRKKRTELPKHSPEKPD
jgi:hypothetical protein